MTTEKPVVLLVDDDEDFANLIRVRFEEIYGHTFRWARDYDEGVLALSEISGETVALVDIHLGGGKSGFELLRYIQQTAADHVVSYAVTGDPSIITLRKALRAGAINVFLKDVVVLDPETGKVITDIRDALVAYAEESLVKRILKGAYEDELTGFLNWWGFKDRAISEMQIARDHQRAPEEKRAGKYPALFSLVMLEVTRLKLIEDECGSKKATEVLQVISAAIRSQVRPADHICRKGEDEFLILMPDAQPARVDEVQQGIRTQIAQSALEVDGEAMNIFLEVGASQVYSEDLDENLELDIELLIAAARRSRKRVSCHIRRAEP